MGFISNLFSNPSDNLPSTGEVEQLSYDDWVRRNPNYSNAFGSTNTTFNGNQANVTQTLSPEMQALLQQQQGFLAQGPAQLGQYQNPFLQGLMQGAANNVSRRWGVDPTAVGTFGGYDGSQPQFNAEQPEVPTVPTGPQPPTGPVNPGGGGGGGIDTGVDGREFNPIPGAGIGGASSGFMGNGNPWADMGQMPAHQLIQKPENKMMSGRSQKGVLNVQSLADALRNIKVGG